MKKELQITFSPQARAEINADPELAEAMRDMCAIMRQAHYAVSIGQYETFDDAMEALTGHRPEKIK